MPACSGGAVVKAGEPTWYYVTDSDLDRWFGTWNVTRLAMELFNGRAYNLAALAAANPDTPPVRSWSDFILSVTGTSAVARVNGVTAYGDELVAYHVFQEHCQCVGVAGGWCTTITCPPYDDIPSFGMGDFGGSTCYATAKLANIPQSHMRLLITTAQAAAMGAWTFYYDAPGGGAYISRYNSFNYDGELDLPTGWHNLTIESRNSLLLPGTGVTVQLKAKAGESPCPGGATAPTVAPSVTMTGAQTLPSLAGATTDQVAQAIFRLQTTVDTYGAVLELLQERIEPFGYRAGPTHAGLTGTGSLALGLCLAVRITLTTVPGTKGKIEGTPDDLFDVGGIHLGDASGWFRFVRIEHTPQLVRDIPAYATVLGYRFPPGVVATIDELVI